MQPPDFETRIVIIKRKAELLETDLPNNMVGYTASRLKNNICQLEGAIRKMKTYYLLAGEALSIFATQTAISDVIDNHQLTSMIIEKIVEEVARTFSTSPEGICPPKCLANISPAQQIVMYAVCEITRPPTTSIGEAFGDRDHSTVVCTTQQVGKNIGRSPKTRDTVQDITKDTRDR